MPDWLSISIGVVGGMGMGLGIGYLLLVWYFNKEHIL